MSIVAVKFLNRNGRKALSLTTHYFVRMTSTNDPCPPTQQEASPQPPKPKDPCPPKAEPSLPEPTPTSTCPEPPPCPPKPPCPSTICPQVTDSSDPCNYCPPSVPDPDTPNLTKLKKLQCLFQEENDIPVFLKKGNFDAFIYQTTCVLIFVGAIASLYATFKLEKK